MLKRRLDNLNGIKGSTLDNGLISWYQLGSNIKDSKNENNPILTGESNFLNFNGLDCLKFTGDNYLDLGTNFQGLINYSFSMSMFFYATSTNRTFQGLLFSNVGDHNALGSHINLESNSVHVNVNNFLMNIYPKNLFNSWNNLVITYDRSKIICYINKIKTYKNYSSYVSLNPNENFFIGRFNVSNRNLIGYMSQVGIWNRALTDNEVYSLYNDGNGVSY